MFRNKLAFRIGFETREGLEPERHYNFQAFSSLGTLRGQIRIQKVDIIEKHAYLLNLLFPLNTLITNKCIKRSSLSTLFYFNF